MDVGYTGTQELPWPMANGSAGLQKANGSDHQAKDRVPSPTFISFETFDAGDGEGIVPILRHRIMLHRIPRG